MRKFTYIDTESSWDEHLHACAVRVDPTDLRYRIECKRIIAAAAMDISVDADGAITCEGISSWSLGDQDDEQAIVSNLFQHLLACQSAFNRDPLSARKRDPLAEMLGG